jgi:hypothetical protein
MKSYKIGWQARFLVGLFLLLPAVIVFFIGVGDANTRTVCLIIAAALGAPGIWLWLAIGKMQLTIDDASVTRRGLFGGEAKLKFDDVSEYRWSIYEVRGSEQMIVTLVAKDGRKLKISNNWRDAWTVAQELIDPVEARLTQPSFEPIRLEPDAIAYKDKRLPYSEIDEAKIVGTALRVSKKGKLLAPISLNMQKIPNLFLLLDALRERGVAAPEARPWRAVVSVAGYQVPKR